jgi:hypothetical protein
MNELIKKMWEEVTFSNWPLLGKFTAGEYDSQQGGIHEKQ